MRRIRERLASLLPGPSEPQAERRHTLVVGLGNPGAEYSKTRHNVGFWCVDRLSKQGSIKLSLRRRQVTLGEGLWAGSPVVLAKPRTFVNWSGEAVSYLLDRYRASPADLLVVYDDMDLEPGRIRLRPQGSAGGHNGMKSIIQSIGTREFRRLRIGIGRPPPEVGDIEHVLSAMPPDERQKIDEAVDRAAEAVESVLVEGFDVAMNRFN